MLVKTVKQSVSFAASPRKVYDLLMVSRKHAGFTGDKARIENRVGGKFSAYGGGLNGYTLELQPGKKIVQAWRCEESGWPKGYYSTATFEFKKAKRGTKLVFIQNGVPAVRFKSISQGWRDYYWKPMREYLGIRCGC